MKIRIGLLAIALVLLSIDSQSQRRRGSTPAPVADTSMDGKFDNFPIRNITPAKTSGRITDIAVDPRSFSIRYVATASGNVWKTVNAGTTWTPIFENYGSYSIGVITIDPNQPNVLWLGTGENNSQRSVGYGDGVYKSEDYGKTWKNMGLPNSEHIGKIVVDPRNSDVVYVAAQGPLWSPGGDRGLFKTIDGGATWERILYVSENTGISEFVMDPANPDNLYAASYQRRRHFGILIAGGPEGGAFRSTNGGATWEPLKNGFPQGDLGRIGMAVSPQKTNVVYALVAGKENTKGFYRSDDYGKSWEKKSNYMVVDAQYYMELFPDPHQFDKVYSVDMRSHYTEDGGSTFTAINENRKHVDSHEIVFHPTDPAYIMFGCDGGIYESWDRMNTWKFTDNMPLTQFYRVGIDNKEPFYTIYGGTQDNASLGGPSRTINRGGIRNSDWFVTTGGDGFTVRVDPTNTNIIYTMSQYAGVVRFDRSSGEKFSIKPIAGEGEPGLKWNWDAPLIISPHNPSRIYFAANKLFKSEDKAMSWTAISGDLSRQEDRNKKEVMGKVWPIDAIFKNVFTSPLGTIVSLDESPVQEGLLYVGTDDGLIQVSEDDGESWRKVEGIPGVPSRAYVGDIFASRSDANTVFAVFNYHKYGDYKPYVYVSNDKGRSWKSISSNLPQREFAWSVVQDHINPKLLFLGTEFGLYYSLNGGQSWNKFKKIPTIPIRDLEVQQRESDMVAASFGRGFYVIDNYTPLREAASSQFEKSAHIFPIKDAWQYVLANPDGGSLGHSFFTSENPPYGAVITYTIKSVPLSEKGKRILEERRAIASGEDAEYPDWDQLLKESWEDRSPSVMFTVSRNDELINRLFAVPRPGVNRTVWNLRSKPYGPTSRGRGFGPMVPPGDYTVKMSIREKGEWKETGEVQTVTVKSLGLNSTPAEDREALFQFQVEAAKVLKEATLLNTNIREGIKKLEAKKTELLRTESLEDLQDINSLLQSLKQIEVDLNGNPHIRANAEIGPPTIMGRLNQAVWSHSNSTTAVTKTQKDSFATAKKAFQTTFEKASPLLSRLNKYK